MVLDSVTKAGKVGLLLYLVALVFFLVGFSMPYWFVAQFSPEKLRASVKACWSNYTSECVSIRTFFDRILDFGIFSYKEIFDHPVVELQCGLWDCCFHKSGTKYCVSIVTNNKHIEDFFIFSTTGWYRSTQALAGVALVAIIANIPVRVFSISRKFPMLYLASVILDFVVGVLIFVAATLFGNGDNTADLRIRLLEPVGRLFGYALYIVGGIFFTGTAICFLVEFLRKR